MKHSANAKKAHSDLQQALDRMLKVLKNLNDSLHVVGLKGFPVSVGGGEGGERGGGRGSSSPTTLSLWWGLTLWGEVGAQ